MKDEPDIVKELMEAERLGMLQSKVQSTYEKLQVLEEQPEDVPDEMSGVCERDVEKKTRNDNTDYGMAEETLRESEEKFRGIFERANDAIILLDKSGRILDVNRKGAVLFGGSKKELVGKHFTKVGIFHLGDAPKLMANFARILTAKESTIDISIKNKKGQEIFLECSGSLMKRDGKLSGMLVVARDITERKRMQDELKESEEKYRNRFENILDAVFIADAETGIIIDCNNAAIELVGRKKSEMVGKHQQILHPPQNDEGKFTSTFKQHLKEKEGQILETQVITKKGKIKDVAIKANIFESRGKKVIQGIFRDITERKKAEEELEKTKGHFQMLFNTMVDPVVIVDSRGKFLEITDRVEEITGFKKEELLGKSFVRTNIVTGKSKRTLLKSLIKRMAGIKLVPYEVEVLTKDGEKIPFEVNAAKIDYMGKSADMVVFRNISDRKKAEEKLKKKNEELDNRTAELNAMNSQLTAMNVELKEAHEIVRNMNSELEQKIEERTEKIGKLLQQKDEFINQLGHDLKTPLTPLVALTPLLRKSVGDKPELIKIVDTLVNSTNHMKNMVDKTLQLANLNSSKVTFEFEETNLVSEINDAIENNQYLLDENNMDVKNMVDEEIIVHVDKLQLDVVFNNLFTNAIKYSKDSKGNIVIDVKKTKDDDEIIVSVKDDGIGITSEQQEHIFDEFYKVDSSRHDLDSSGLGLAICKHIVEHHGGRIWVESYGPGRGCTFYFTLKTGGKKDEK